MALFPNARMGPRPRRNGFRRALTDSARDGKGPPPPARGMKGESEMNIAETIIAMRLNGSDREQDAIEAAVCVFTDEVNEDGIAPVYGDVAAKLERRAEEAEGRDSYVQLLREILANGTADEKAFVVEAVSRYVRRVVRNKHFPIYRNRAEIIDLLADITALDRKLS